MDKYDRDTFKSMLNAFMEHRREKYGLKYAVLGLNKKDMQKISSLTYTDRNGIDIQFNPLRALTGKKSRTNSLYELATFWVKENNDKNVRYWADKIQPWHFNRTPTGTWTKMIKGVIVRTNYKLARQLTQQYVTELTQELYAYEWMVFLRATKRDFDIKLTDKLFNEDISFNGGIMLQRVYGDRAPAALIDLFNNSEYKEKYPFLTIKMMREKQAATRLRIFLETTPKKQLEKILRTSYVKKE